MMNKSNESPIDDEPLTADKVDFETLIRRFSNATFDCDTIRKHVTECKAYVTACRVTADAPDAHKYNLALLATAMQTHGFTPPDAADLDAVDAYLDNIDRGAGKVMFDEQQALNAVMQLPFVFTVLGGFPDGMGEEIAKTTDAASKDLSAADQLQREIIVCRMVCGIERIAERWIEQGMGAFRTVCAFANKQGGAGSVQADNGHAAVAQALTNLTAAQTNLTAALTEAQADEKKRQAEIIAAINAKKQDARDNLAGSGRAITRLKAENTTLKAKIAARKS